MDAILLIIGLLFGILNIILFFKVWTMTNDVSYIKEYIKYAHESKNENEIDEQNSENLEYIAKLLAAKFPDLVERTDRDEE